MIAITIFYLCLVAIITVTVLWNVWKSENIYEKIMGAMMLVLLILRLFMIK